MSIIVVAAIVAVAVAVVIMAFASAPATSFLESFAGGNLPFEDWIVELYYSVNEFLPVRELGMVIVAMGTLAVGVGAVKGLFWLYHQFWGSD